jgi:hypothetical protein
MIGEFRHKGLEEIYLTGKTRRIAPIISESAFASCSCWKSHGNRRR